MTLAPATLDRKIHDHHSLKRLRFPVTNVGLVAPLLDSADRGGSKRGIALDDSRAGNFAVLIDDSLQHHWAMDLVGTGPDRIRGLLGMHQPVVRTFGRENDSGGFSGQLGLRWTAGGGLCVGSLGAGIVLVGQVPEIRRAACRERV